MEMAKVTSKGQITIPISIRRRLGINEGDKLLFIDRPEGVMMVNPDSLPGGSSADEIEAPAPVKKKAAPKPRPPAAAVETKAEPPAKPPVEQPLAAEPPTAEPPSEVVKRPVPPPVEEPEKPDVTVGGFNLSTLLDEIRSIGSNI
jgi:AbrB family looped-hinge helix DNA binding protein